MPEQGDLSRREFFHQLGRRKTLVRFAAGMFGAVGGLAGLFRPDADGEGSMAAAVEGLQKKATGSSPAGPRDLSATSQTQVNQPLSADHSTPVTRLVALRRRTHGPNA